MKFTKYIKILLCVALALSAVMSVGLVASAAGETASPVPVYYLAFDDAYYEDSIGNAYGFDKTEYINVEGDEGVSGAIRLTYEKSPYIHMGTYGEDGYNGVFDPYFCLPVYEFDGDIKCEDAGFVVVTVRIPETADKTDSAMMYFDTTEFTVIDGDGDWVAGSSYKDTSGFQNITFSAKNNKQWTGVLQNLRIDPFSKENDAMDYIDIAGVAFFSSFKDARAFDGNYKNLESDNDAAEGGDDTKTSAFTVTYMGAFLAALGLSGMLKNGSKAKKIAAVLMAIMLVLSVFAGCGGDKETPDSGEQSTQSPEGDYVPETITMPEENLVESRENSDYRYDVYETYIKITKYIGLKPEVTIPDEIDGLPVKVIGFKAFFRNYVLDDKDPEHKMGVEKLTICDNVEIIEDYAFAGIEEVEEITFGKNLRYIGRNAIQNAYSLKKVNFTGDSLEIIDAWAFTGCILLGEINVPESVKYVGAAAFMWNRSMENLSIPSGAVQGKGVTFGQTEIKGYNHLDNWL